MGNEMEVSAATEEATDTSMTRGSGNLEDRSQPNLTWEAGAIS
jgi:hypothetical protein